MPSQFSIHSDFTFHRTMSTNPSNRPTDSNMTSSNSTKDSKGVGLPLPYNSYNIFFILERTLLLESRENGAASSTKMVRPRPGSEMNGEAPCTGYECIDLPPLPPRYKPLESVLKANWYDPGRKRYEKRKHTKTHGGK